MDGLYNIAAFEKYRKQGSNSRNALAQTFLIAAAAVVAEHATADEVATLEATAEHTSPNPVPEASAQSQPEANADQSNPNGQKQTANSPATEDATLPELIESERLNGELVAENITQDTATATDNIPTQSVKKTATDGVQDFNVGSDQETQHLQSVLSGESVVVDGVQGITIAGNGILGLGGISSVVLAGGAVLGAAVIGVAMSGGGGSGGGGQSNSAPTAVALNNTTVDENAIGAIIGDLSTTDPDTGDTHTYGVDNTNFEVINSQLKLKDGIALDYETAATVDVTVTATDSGGLSFTQNFTITVNDVPENVVQTGTDGADYIVGTLGDDALAGLGGDDTLRGEAGADSIDGGIGDDAARYLGDKAGYEITWNANENAWHVKDIDLSNGNDGEDVLVNIERLAFADQPFSLVTDRTYAHLAESYVYIPLDDLDGGSLSGVLVDDGKITVVDYIGALVVDGGSFNPDGAVMFDVTVGQTTNISYAFAMGDSYFDENNTNISASENWEQANPSADLLTSPYSDLYIAKPAQQSVEYALETFASFLPIDFQLAAEGQENSADWNFYLVNEANMSAIAGQDNIAGLTNLGYGGIGPIDSDGWAHDPGAIELLELAGQDWSFGGFWLETIFHEIQHGLGINHPHSEGPSDGIFFPGATSSDNAGTYGANDTAYTIMSYLSSQHTVNSFITPTPMDMYTLQLMYGTNNNNNGDDTYTLQDAIDNNYYKTIWDTGGEDTVTYAGSENITIDLRFAHFDLNAEVTEASYLQNFGRYSELKDGSNNGGLIIAQGAIIENATGGDGSDIIIANNVNNKLTGGAGNDAFIFATAADANGDVITDLDVSFDKIDLSRILNEGFTYVSAGSPEAATLKAGELQSQNASLDIGGQIVDGAYLQGWVDHDGGEPNFQIFLEGITQETLDASHPDWLIA